MNYKCAENTDDITSQSYFYSKTTIFPFQETSDINNTNGKHRAIRDLPFCRSQPIILGAHISVCPAQIGFRHSTVKHQLENTYAIITLRCKSTRVQFHLGAQLCSCSSVRMSCNTCQHCCQSGWAHRGPGGGLQLALGSTADTCGLPAPPPPGRGDGAQLGREHHLGGWRGGKGHLLFGFRQ